MHNLRAVGFVSGAFLAVTTHALTPPPEAGGIELFANTLVTPSDPGTVIEAHGWWDDPGMSAGDRWLMGAALYDMQADEAGWVWVETIKRAVPPPVPPARWEDGEIDGPIVRGIAAGQSDFGPSVPGDRDNPYFLWRGRWETSDFTPRVVEFATTKHLRFAVSGQGPETDLVATGAFQGGRIAIVVRTDCLADLDGNGELDLFDFVAFQNFFMDASPVADLDADGDLTIFDFLVFQNAFDAGC
ncbi:MAG: GC-type dockerin domain-anchored protein [Phycisphaerales bacterium]